MMLTFDEYMDLKKLLDSSKEAEGVRLEETLVKPKKRKSTRYQKALSKAMEEANKLQPNLEVDWGQSISFFQSRAVDACKGIKLESQS